ncbi:MAG TPA: type I polyketide synthase, partial [Thermoanaerobaculia bacterium]|nr:type I polyketide synthase [Thermoanaerobaculia bacterium]
MSEVAIIGMAVRFPGAASLERFWENLRDGVESVSFFGDEELLAAGVDPALLRDPAYVRARAVVDGVEDFDAAFFGFTPREAAVMDPQHRLLLECAWEALEDAGYDPERAGGRTAVYAGSGTSSYLFANLLPNAPLLAAVGPLQAMLLNDRDFLATRLSYKLGLKGPSLLVQTACSTGLAAVHVASQGLLSGESDLALAGAVSIALPAKEGYLYEEGGIASPDGHCRAFDAAAGGSVVGNGAGVVVLKRLADALADGDRVYAVIRGSAVNNDGAARVGFTAPSVEGQAEVITESLLMAGVEPASIAYVEGHGSGTALGDPIEVTALVQAFAAAGGTDACALGSVKSNVGHLNTAAGLAGLVKAVLALQHATIPPSLHFARPNPQCDFGPFHVPTRALPWPAERSPRRAAVSSFGLGGTNVHAVLEEAPAAEPSGPSRPWQLLTVSARTETALDAACRRLADRLESEDLNLADVAFTLQRGRKAFAKRRAVVCRDRAEAVAALRAGRGARGGFEGSERPVVFLFPGLGDHAVGMGRGLYESEPVFAAEVDRCAAILAPHLGVDLRDVLFAEPGPRPASDLRTLLRRNAAPLDEAGQRLARTEYAQPAVFVVEYALARLLLSWGVRPQAMIGYSLGEYVAAALAGVLSLEDALALVAGRAKLIQELPAGAMLAVPLPESEVGPLLNEDLSLAATNGPHFCV